jgi:hypothetical protein
LANTEIIKRGELAAMKEEAFVREGSKPREHLNLPIMSYAVADYWIDQLPETSFKWWMKFHTFVNRRDAKRDGEIPRSLESVIKKLGTSKKTFYKYIKPLWEFGLIEIIEYEESERNSQKPKNIIVYEYPLNRIERKFKPLEKLRDWDKDYHSISKTAGKLGGLARKIEAIERAKETETMDGFQTETVPENVDNHGFQTETVDGFQTETVTVSKRKPNNYTNISTNKQISSNNYTNKEKESEGAMFDNETSEFQNKTAEEKPAPASRAKKKKKKDPDETKIRYAEFVAMTAEQYQKLLETHGEQNVKLFIEKLDNHKGATGTTYKSDYHAILKWVINAVAEDREKQQKKQGGQIRSGTDRKDYWADYKTDW